MFGNTDVPYVRPITIANPAPGAEFSLTAPGQGIWRIVGLRATIVASAAVATRIPSLTLVTSDGVVAEYGSTGTITAGQTHRYSAFSGSPNMAGTGSLHLWAFPTDGALLLPGFALTSATEAIDVADQWSLIRALVVEYPTGPQWRLTPDVATIIEPKA